MLHLKRILCNHQYVKTEGSKQIDFLNDVIVPEQLSSIRYMLSVEKHHQFLGKTYRYDSFVSTIS